MILFNVNCDSYIYFLNSKGFYNKKIFKKEKEKKGKKKQLHYYYRLQNNVALVVPIE